MTTVKSTSEKSPWAEDAPKLVGMTFNMEKDWHRRFKMRALQEDISMRELLIRSFEAYEKENR